MTKIIVDCIGGLGNQMFQYAFYKELEFLGYDVRFYTGSFRRYSLHNGYELEKIFDIKPKYITDITYYLKFFSKIKNKIGFFKNKVVQNDVNFNIKYLKYSRDTYLIGYWQSEKYFKDVKDKLKKCFTFPPLIDAVNIRFKSLIESNNAVSIHVRRGDYVGHELYDGVCNLAYYDKAIEYIQKHVEMPHFFVFSNDIQWCKENLLLKHVTYVTGNESSYSYNDMHLMSLCKYNILANSSFSWWAGWLNKFTNKIVIVPKKFFNKSIYNECDIYLDTWVRV